MKMKKIYIIVALLAIAGIANAQLMAYSQDFEGLEPAANGSTSLGDDGWLVFGNVFGPDWGYWYGYGPFPAPNNVDNPGFSNVATGEGGVPQGAQQLNVFSDYNNADHGNGAWIESNVFQQQTVGIDDVGEIVTFSFDAKLGNLTGSTTAIGFIKTLDGGSLIDFETVDMTSIPTTWDTYQVSLPIDAGLVGKTLQFGFANTATAYEGSGVFYDNVSFVIPEPSSIALLAVAGAGMWGFRRHIKS